MDLHPVRTLTLAHRLPAESQGKTELTDREGILTVLAGLLAYWAIVDYPETAKFLTEEERAWTVWVRSSDQGKYGEADHVTFK
jgi:hypothetical protein